MEEEQKYILLDENVQCQFPYEIQDHQKKMMTDIIKNLKNGGNCMYESPTGSGKTLCFIIASLSYLKWSGQKNKIIFLTKTQSQVNSVLQECQKIREQCSLFKDFRYTFRTSRENLCVNGELLKQKENLQKLKDSKNSQFDDLCKDKVKNCQCIYFKKDQELYKGYLYDFKDIEDLKQIGEEQKICPYFYTKQDIDFDLIILNYNYVINQRIMSIIFSKLNVVKPIIIIDEAHNLQKVIIDQDTLNIKDHKLMSIKVSLEQIAQNQILEILEKEFEQKTEKGNSDEKKNRFNYLGKIKLNSQNLIQFDGEQMIEFQDRKSEIEWISNNRQKIEELSLVFMQYFEHISIFITKESKQIPNYKSFNGFQPDGVAQIKKIIAQMVDIRKCDLNEQMQDIIQKYNLGVFQVFYDSLLFLEQTFKIVQNLIKELNNKYKEKEKEKPEKNQLGQFTFTGISSFVQWIKLIKQFLIAGTFAENNFQLNQNVAKHFALKIIKKKRKFKQLQKQQQEQNNINSAGITYYKANGDYIKNNQQEEQWYNSICFQKLSTYGGLLHVKQKLDPRSVLLCSGTMKPFFSLFQNLGIQFNFYTNDSVFDNEKQLFVKNIERIEDKKINFSSKNFMVDPKEIQFNEQNNSQQELEQKIKLQNSESVKQKIFILVMRIKELIENGGILLFFTSYEKMECFYSYFDSEVKKRQNSKNIEFYKESTKVQENKQSYIQFQKDIENKKKAIFFVIMGGKYSEGINFAHDMCKILIVIGLPFENPIYFKIYKDYYDHINKEDPSIPDGDTAYSLNCAIKISQTLGRGIRNATDNCLCLIVDERLSQSYQLYSNVRNNLSNWLMNGFAGKMCDGQKEFYKLEYLIQQAQIFFEQVKKLNCPICLDNNETDLNKLYVTACCFQIMHQKCYEDLYNKDSEKLKCPLCKSEKLKLTSKIQYYERYYQQNIEVLDNQSQNNEEQLE